MAARSDGHTVLQPWTEAGVTLPNGQVVTKLVIGDEDDPDATCAFIAKWPPGCVVDAHTHTSHYCEVILEGSQQVGRQWFHAGDVRLARAGQVYGPLTAGEDGCTIMVIFDGGGWEPVPARTSRVEGLDVTALTQPDSPDAEADGRGARA